VGTEPLACFLKFHFQRENAKPDRHSHRDGRKLKPHGPLLSRTLNTLTCIGFPTRAKSFGEGEAGLAARRTVSLAPANLFLTLAWSAAPKFQSQETSRQQRGDRITVDFAALRSVAIGTKRRITF
jgi:hypothetical protein